MGLYKIKDHLENAKQLMEAGSSRSLNFACLELRYCLEKIAYRQLEQYGDDIPHTVLSPWQPDKILKLLASIDPVIAQNPGGGGRLEFALGGLADPRPQEWRGLGEIEWIPWKRFRKHYQQLGSFLHAHKGQEVQSPKKDVLIKITDDVEKVANSTVIVAFKATNTAKCPCGDVVVATAAARSQEVLLSCSNPKCRILYQNRRLESGNWVLEAMGDFAIACGCGSKIHVDPDFYNNFKCGGCGRKPVINLAPPT